MHRHDCIRKVLVQEHAGELAHDSIWKLWIACAAERNTSIYMKARWRWTSRRVGPTRITRCLRCTPVTRGVTHRHPFQRRSPRLDCTKTCHASTIYTRRFLLFQRIGCVECGDEFTQAGLYSRVQWTSNVMAAKSTRPCTPWLVFMTDQTSEHATDGLEARALLIRLPRQEERVPSLSFAQERRNSLAGDARSLASHRYLSSEYRYVPCGGTNVDRNRRALVRPRKSESRCAPRRRARRWRR